VAVAMCGELLLLCLRTAVGVEVGIISHLVLRLFLRLLVVALRHRSSPHHCRELGTALSYQPPCHQRTHHHAHLSFFNLQCRNGSPYLISNSWMMAGSSASFKFDLSPWLRGPVLVLVLVIVMMAFGMCTSSDEDVRLLLLRLLMCLRMGGG